MQNYRIKLRRSVLDRVFGGVCGGCGDCLGISGWWVRISFVLLTLSTAGFGVLLYMLLWVGIPQQRWSDLSPLTQRDEPPPQRLPRPEGVLTLGAASIFAGVIVLADQAGVLRTSGGADLLPAAMLLMIGLVVLVKHLRGVA